MVLPEMLARAHYTCISGSCNMLECHKRSYLDEETLKQSATGLTPVRKAQDFSSGLGCTMLWTFSKGALKAQDPLGCGVLGIVNIWLSLGSVMVTPAKVSHPSGNLPSYLSQGWHKP